MNDYLSKAFKTVNILTDYTTNYIKSERLFVGLADHSTEAILEMPSKDRKWEMKAFGRLLSLTEHILNDMIFDYVICG